MEFFPNKFQFCFFADYSDLKASSEVIKTLIDVFSDHELLPSTYQELAAGKPVSTRIQMASAAGGQWVVQFESNRINIEKNPTDIDLDTLGGIDTFTTEAIAMLGRVIEHYPKNATRLSLVVTNLSSEIAEGELERVYAKAAKPLRFYEGNEPFEWGVRAVARIERTISRVPEELNVVTALNRIQGTFHSPEKQIDLDRLRVMSDINTNAGNTDSRFTVLEAREFASAAVDIQRGIHEQLLEMLGE